MAIGITVKRAFAAGISALALLAPVQAGAAIYIKFDDIKGESTRAAGVEPDEIDNRVADDASAGDEHEVEYDLVAAASADSGGGHEVAHVVQQRASAPAARAAGVEREEIGARPQPAADKDHKDWILLDSVSSPVFREHASGMATGKRAAAPRDAASGLATGKRQHKPIAMATDPDSDGDGAAELKLPPSRGPGNVTLKRGTMACVAGTHFPAAHLRDDGGHMATLTNVTVESCSAEQISLNYEEIK